MSEATTFGRPMGALLVFALLLCACGDDDSGGDSAATGGLVFSEELCDVLTEEDLAVVGTLDSVEAEVEAEGSAPTVFCNYAISEPITSVILNFFGGLLGDPAEVDGFLESGDYEEVDGLGVAAVRHLETRSLQVWTEHPVRIDFITLGGDDEDEVLLALAEAAVAGLDAPAG